MPDKALLTDRARTFRRNPTEPEIRLWRHPSNSQSSGHKFRRQAAIDPFIVDFLCPAKALVVEVDGDTHDPAADARRDALLLSKGYTTIRFTNPEVMTNMEGVLTVIAATLASQPDRWPQAKPHPDPSPEGEGPRSSASPSDATLGLLATESPSPSGKGLGWGTTPPHHATPA